MAVLVACAVLIAESSSVCDEEAKIPSAPEVAVVEEKEEDDVSALHILLALLVAVVLVDVMPSPGTDVPAVVLVLASCTAQFTATASVAATLRRLNLWGRSLASPC